MKVLEEENKEAENKGTGVLGEMILNDFDKINNSSKETEENSLSKALDKRILKPFDLILGAFFSQKEMFLKESLNSILNSSLYKSGVKELKLIARGKVRDVYALNEQQLLFVSTDRISAYDVVLDNVSTILYRFRFLYCPRHPNTTWGSKSSFKALKHSYLL